MTRYRVPIVFSSLFMKLTTPLRRRVLAVGAVVCLTSLAPDTTHAGLLLIGNLDHTSSEAKISIGGGSGVPPGEVHKGAVKFTLPVGTDYTLDDAILRLSRTQRSDPKPVISLHSDDAGGSAPGTTLATLSNPTFPDNSMHDFTFTPADTVTLSSNTTYWLLLGGAETLNYKWSIIDALPSQPIATLDNYYFSFNNGSSYFGDDGLPGGFAINASVIPEPSTALLMLLSAIGLAPFWWRRWNSSPRLPSQPSEFF